MRAIVLLVVAAALSGAGCLGQGSVRAVMLEETIVLDDDAPPSAYERIPTYAGCAPGRYDPQTQTIRFADNLSLPREVTPRFAVIMPRPEGHVVMSAGSGGGPFGLDLGTIEERGARGAWGFSSPFPGASLHARLEWSHEGVAFDDVELPAGETVPFGWRYEATWDNVTFGVAHSFLLTYLGRVDYTSGPVC